MDRKKDVYDQAKINEVNRNTKKQCFQDFIWKQDIHVINNLDVPRDIVDIILQIWKFQEIQKQMSKIKDEQKQEKQHEVKRKELKKAKAELIQTQQRSEQKDFEAYKSYIVNKKKQFIQADNYVPLHLQKDHKMQESLDEQGEQNINRIDYFGISKNTKNKGFQKSKRKKINLRNEISQGFEKIQSYQKDFGVH